MKIMRPTMSNLAWPPSALLSGVPQIITIETTETTIEAMKMLRQLNVDAMKPPKSAASPEPPHEPMDHIETARCRPSPSQ